jgi:hypothetical protein
LNNSGMLKSRSRNAIHMEVFFEPRSRGWPAKLQKANRWQRSRGCLLV